jgi:hypothetical protein
MLLLAAILIGMPMLTILTSVGWAWRTGSLAESPAERTEWEFEKIVRRI